MGHPGRSRPVELDRLAKSLARHRTTVRKVEVPKVGHDAAGTQPPIIDFFDDLLTGHSPPSASASPTRSASFDLEHSYRLG
ncbi:hypothetical protein [Nonomuraea sp. NPDC049480]|uniref:hypothetical protein n=1 Tax=Nonomuraea sp. NPDC049480 TaxID=3364353 RepID=UPI00379255FB